MFQLSRRLASNRALTRLEPIPTPFSLSHVHKPLNYSPLPMSSASNRAFASHHDSSDDVTKQKPEDSIFAKIVAKKIPAKIVYEDDLAMSFKDVNPCAPHHLLVIPKKPIGGVGVVEEADEQVLGHLFVVARKVAELEGFDKTGYRLVVNEGKHGQQSVRWLHVHVIGGKQLTWPPFAESKSEKH